MPRNPRRRARESRRRVVCGPNSSVSRAGDLPSLPWRFETGIWCSKRTWLSAQTGQKVEEKGRTSPCYRHPGVGPSAVKGSATHPATGPAIHHVGKSQCQYISLATWSRFPNALPGQTGGNETFLNESLCFHSFRVTHATRPQWGQRRRSGRWKGRSSDGLLCLRLECGKDSVKKRQAERLGNVAHVAMGEGCRSRKDQLCSNLLITAAPIVGKSCRSPPESAIRRRTFFNYPKPDLQYNISWEAWSFHPKDRSIRNTSRIDFLERHPRSIAIHFGFHIYPSGLAIANSSHLEEGDVVVVCAPHLFVYL
ncbi:hypothetical protein V8E54_002798 [Elaphomyces granulatus]|jgi:hypothetical protein